MSPITLRVIFGAELIEDLKHAPNAQRLIGQAAAQRLTQHGTAATSCGLARLRTATARGFLTA